MADLKTNVLYYGDNLEILRRYLPDESVDLIYLDPPFNSQQQYNVLFKESGGAPSVAQIRAFTDTWHWDRKAEATYQEIIVNSPLKVSKAIEALREFIGSNDVMAYLTMMTARLVELHRVLKSTGSLYLHCDPTASHYLKVILDTIFGTGNFRNEVIWKRTHAHSGGKSLGSIHDTILFYSKSGNYSWKPTYMEYSDEYVKKFFRFSDPDGRRYRVTILTGSGVRTGSSGKPWRGLDPTEIGRHWAIPGYVRPLLGNENLPDAQSALDKLNKIGRVIWPSRTGIFPSFKQYLNDMEGVEAQDIWTDIPPISSQAKERLGYQTQKPQALLERIIRISSNQGDVVLDPFCGCGTAVVAAQKLNRRWIGIDVTHLAITVMKKRLEDSFPGLNYEVVGEPKDVTGAEALARQDRYQFQWWALSLVNALPQSGEKKKGADQGIDGVISFMDDRKGKARRIIVSVKSGTVGVKDVRELKSVIGEENLGLMITLRRSTEPMRVEAATAGFHHSILWERDFPRIQIMIIEELLQGKKPDLPQGGKLRSFAKAQRIEPSNGQLMMAESAETYNVDGGEGELIEVLEDDEEGTVDITAEFKKSVIEIEKDR